MRRRGGAITLALLAGLAAAWLPMTAGADPAAPSAAQPGGDAALYADDPGHPIPSVGTIDLIGKRRGGGADLFVLVASPLAADARSQSRLLQKIQNYLGFIQSSDYRVNFGAPDPTSTRIVVRIDRRSDPVIFALLRKCEPWALANHASLVVDISAEKAQ